VVGCRLLARGLAQGAAQGAGCAGWPKSIVRSEISRFQIAKFREAVRAGMAKGECLGRYCSLRREPGVIHYQESRRKHHLMEC
jgi:hypothetical protein